MIFIVKVIFEAAVITAAGIEIVLLTVGVPEDEIAEGVLFVAETTPAIPPIEFPVRAMEDPSQISDAAAVTETAGSDPTLTVAVTVFPLHELAVGVTVYVALPKVFAVVLFKICEMDVPEPALAPEIPVCVAVQTKDVPAILLPRANDVVLPLQMD